MINYNISVVLTIGSSIEQIRVCLVSTQEQNTDAGSSMKGIQVRNSHHWGA